MPTFLLRLLRPPKFENLETTRIARQLHYVVLSGIFTAGFISIITYFFNNTASNALLAYGSAPLIPTVATISLMILYLFLRSGRVKAVILCIIGIGCVSITSSLVVSGYGIRDTSAAIFILLLVLSSVYLSARATFLLGILSLMIIVLVWLGEYLHIIETVNPGPSVDSLLTLVTGIGFSTVFLRATVNRILESSAKIRDQAAELESNNQDLRNAQRVLEAQTAELSRLNEELQRQITERELTESLLRQRQKLDSIGLLAGGVAHDFNNLLTGMIAQSTLALRKIGPDHVASSNVSKAINSAKRGEDLTRQLLAYAGRSKFLAEPFNLNELIRDSKGLFDSLIQHSVMLQYHLVESLPAIVADQGQIQQILMNLIVNASQAVKHDLGVIHIRTYRVSAESISDSDLMVSPFISGVDAQRDNTSGGLKGEYVVLSVKDNGSGMDTEMREKIFDPYFTTKQDGHGLGLSALAGIVRALKGGVSVTSQVGEGSTFSIYLPARIDQPLIAPQRQPPTVDRPPTAGGTVLIIDDEVSIVESTAEILQDAGYGILSATNAEDGLALFFQLHESIDIVLLDVHMPGMDGVSAYEQMQEISSTTSVILSSGYATVELPPDFFTHPNRGFLPKPYSVENLLDEMDKATQSR